MIAAAKGQTEIVKLLIESRADVNARREDGWTALMVAAINGHEEVVKLLIAGRADVNAKARHGRTALKMVEQNIGRDRIVELLKAAGATE